MKVINQIAYLIAIRPFMDYLEWKQLLEECMDSWEWII